MASNGKVPTHKNVKRIKLLYLSIWDKQIHVVMIKLRRKVSDLFDNCEFRELQLPRVSI